MANETSPGKDTYKPNGRPQSTIALNFSADLDSAFSINQPESAELTGLAQSVEQKKQAVSSQSQELQALEARLRETEERLKKSTTTTTTMGQNSSGSGIGSVSGSGSTARRKEAGGEGREDGRLKGDIYSG